MSSSEDMNQVDVSAIIALAGFLFSVLVSVFVAGMGWASVKKDVQSLQREIAEVKGMFVLRLRDDLHSRDK
jgi:outer membrane lipoprotein-sorting protein